MHSTIHDQFYTEEAIAREPWFDDTTLYQPFEDSQILLAENASCLAVKTFLKMCKLKFQINTTANAEYMSHGGRRTKLPLIKSGAFFVAEFEQIVNFVENKGISLSSILDADQKLDMRAHMHLVENIFTNAELYISFLDEEVLKEITYPRIKCVYPWPLDMFECWSKRQEVLQQLKVYGWRNFDLEEVVEKVHKCCYTLNLKLERNQYFYGDKPTELDALIFGHIFTVFTTHLPNNILAETIREFPSLIRFCKQIEKSFFKI